MPPSSPVTASPSTGWEAFDVDTGAYYSVSILDIKMGQILCCFEPTWKISWVASGHVRRSATSSDSGSVYTVGQQVEVKVQSHENQPCGYWKSIIKSIKNNCALVHFVGLEDSSDDIVELSYIRPEPVEKSIDLTHIKRVDLTLPPVLKKSPSLPQPGSPDVTHVPVFTSVVERSGVVSISYCVTEHKIVVIGTDSSLVVARPLIDMAVAQQAQLQHIHNRTELAKLQLRIAKEKAEHSFVEEFPVSPSLFGLVIGQNGSRINSVQNMPGIMSANIDTQTGMVRIVGENVDAVRLARAQLEFIELDLPIAPEMANWVRGKGNKTIQQLEGMSKAHHMRIVEDAEKGTCVVHIAGTKDAVQSARLLVEQHIDYRAEWDKADQEQKQIMQQLYEMRRGQQRVAPVAKDDEKPVEGESSQPESPPVASTAQEKPNEKRRFRNKKWSGKKKEGQKTPPRQDNGRKAQQASTDGPGNVADVATSKPSKQPIDGVVESVTFQETSQ